MIGPQDVELFDRDATVKLEEMEKKIDEQLRANLGSIEIDEVNQRTPNDALFWNEIERRYREAGWVVGYTKIEMGKKPKLFIKHPLYERG